MILGKSLNPSAPHCSQMSCCCCLVVSNSFATPWTVARQLPLSMGFLRQEYWGGLPFPSPGDLPDLGIEPVSPAWQGDSLLIQPPRKPRTEHLIFFSAFGGDGI